MPINQEKMKAKYKPRNVTTRFAKSLRPLKKLAQCLLFTPPQQQRLIGRMHQICAPPPPLEAAIFGHTTPSKFTSGFYQVEQYLPCEVEFVELVFQKNSLT